MSLLSKIVKKEVDLEDYRSSPQGQSIFKKLESKVNLREQFLKIDPSIEIKKVGFIKRLGNQAAVGDLTRFKKFFRRS